MQFAIANRLRATLIFPVTFSFTLPATMGIDYVTGF